jgi:hypothetical protein
MTPIQSQAASLAEWASAQSWTGLALAAGGKKAVLCQDGKIFTGYIDQAKGVEMVQADRAEQWPAREALAVALPATALPFARIMIEQPGQMTTLEINGRDLAAYLDTRKQSPLAVLIHCQWPDAEAFALVAGSAIPYRRYIFLAPRQVLEGQQAFDAILARPIGRAIVHEGTLDSEAWLQVHLRILFEWLVSFLMERYGYMTGKMMIASVKRDLSIHASRAGLDFDLSAAELVDRTLFLSPDEMAAKYRDAVKQAVRHIQAVIGTGMMTILLQQVHAFVNSNYRALIQRYELIQ